MNRAARNDRAVAPVNATGALPIVTPHEVATMLYGDDIPIMHRRWRPMRIPGNVIQRGRVAVCSLRMNGQALPLHAVSSEIAEAALEVAAEAVAELAYDGQVFVVFVEPGDDPAAPVGRTLKGFTSEQPGLAFIVHPYGTDDIRAAVRHEVYHVVAEARGMAHDHASVREFSGEPVIDPGADAGDVFRGSRIDLTNADSTVIIDGTSNMFKISATGTTSVAVADDGNSSADTILTGLGALPTTPAHLSFIAAGNTTGEAQHVGSMILAATVASWAAAALNGSAVRKFLALRSYADIKVRLNASDEAVVRIEGWISGVAADTFFGRFYVLKEAAL